MLRAFCARFNGAIPIDRTLGPVYVFENTSAREETRTAKFQ